MTPISWGVALFLKALAHHKGGSQRLAAIAVLRAVKIDALANREYQGLFMEVCLDSIRAQSSYLSTRFNARAMRVLGERGARLHETEQVPGIGGVYTEPQPDAFDSTPEIHSFRAVQLAGRSVRLGI